MSVKEIKFNINHYVKVKLTDKGREIHREEYEKLMSNLSYDYTPPKEDEDGYSK